MELDRDLYSIQEVRNLIAKAKEAQKTFEALGQERIDGVVRAVALACEAESVRLAKMACEETGFGIWQDKVFKTDWAAP